jgi:hypothetical protein
VYAMSFDYEKAMLEGHGFNEYVASVLRQYGVPEVYVPEFTIASTHDAIADKTKNEKDIVVNGLVLEVKSRAMVFNSLDDFPLSSIIVDTVYGFDQKLIKPYAYVYISQKTKAMFAIPVSSRQFWTMGTIFDTARKIQVECFFVTKRHCKPFIELVDNLLDQAANNDLNPCD